MDPDFNQTGVLSESTCPSFAVLLAAYNGMQWLPEQIESILSQVDVKVTVYVSVDVSDDGTYAWVCDLAAAESRVVPLAYGDVFGGAAKNFFRLLRDVDLALFDYIAFSDQDDIWLPLKLENARRHISARGCDGYSSNVTAFWPNGRSVLVNKAQAQQKWDYLFEAAGPGCTYVLTTVLAQAVKNCVISSRSYLDAISLHDWFIYAFARAQGYVWYIDPSPSLLYRQHESNQVGVNSGSKAIRFRLGLIFNGWWISQAFLISRVLYGDQVTIVSGLGASYRRTLLCLSLRGWYCRRRLRDKFFFVFTCLLLMLKGPSKGERGLGGDGV